MLWNLPQPVAAEKVHLLQDELGVSPLIATLLVRRGVETFDQARAFFRPNLEHLHNPFLMKDMDLAVKRIIKALENNERILVFGDYDVDGTTAVALMASYLRTLDAEVDTYIPDRYSEGYGISFQGIDYASDNEFTLIIALDCGIKSIEHVAYANEKNIDFIICDHHLPGNIVPDAYAVLDPKQTDCAYPFKELCGCGVGFKLIQAVQHTLNLPFEALFPYLDLVAVAIAADIVPIEDENRVLAYYGLQQLNKRQRPGFAAMMQLFSVKQFSITDVVFKIAPRINAAGRMEHGKYAVQLLTEFDEFQAQGVAQEIEAFNAARKAVDEQITQEALQQITETGEENQAATVVFAPHWNKGVIGIVASRLIEKFYRPTLVFTQSGSVLAASARSVKDFDVYETLQTCSDLLEQFGGHKYAAGMTLLEENYAAFKEKFIATVAAQIAPESLEEQLDIDAIVDFKDLDEKSLRILKQFEPHGPGNRHPVLATSEVYDTGFAQTIGKTHDHLKLFVRQAGSADFPAIAFGKGNLVSLLGGKQKMQMVYSLQENEWKEKVFLQLQVKDIRITDEKEIFSKNDK